MPISLRIPQAIGRITVTKTVNPRTVIEIDGMAFFLLALNVSALVL